MKTNKQFCADQIVAPLYRSRAPISTKRVLMSTTLGAVHPRLLAVMLLLFILTGFALLLLRPTPQTSKFEARAPSPLEVSRTNLVLVEGRLRQPGRSNSFSGFMVEHYPSGCLLSRSAITNGLLHGLSQGWHTNGQLQITEQFKEGVSHGPRVKWYSSGAKQSEASITDGKLDGAFRKWHENGLLSEQMEFVHGQPEGASVSYFPSGCLKARVVVMDAKPIQQEFWKDGEKRG